MAQKPDQTKIDNEESDRLRDEVVRRMAGTPPKERAIPIKKSDDPGKTKSGT